ncbi:MAG: general secretion pathway protein GspB [Candidatus Thiodiazotropha sp.]
MSLILEALKKAERQHKLGEVPKISPNAEQPTTSGPHGMGWVMIALLALILLGIGIYLGSNSWLSPQGVDAEIPLSETEPKIDLPSSEAQKTPPLQREEAIGGSDPSYVESPVVKQSQPQAEIPTPQPLQAELPQVNEIEPAQVTEAEPMPPPPPPAPPKPLHEMPSGFVANLPAMNIDIHSYSSRAAKRYVLINMEKYREGDYLAEGPRVVEILPQGAVMEHMGERFILPIGNQ